MNGTAANDTMLVVVRFRIGGRLRFLSHAETLSLFQKACVRAAISLRYSEGFNPRPKISLPLPRSVGVEAREDLLCLRVRLSPGEFENEQFTADLAHTLPEGCEVLSARTAGPGTSFHPEAADYVFEVGPEFSSGTLADSASSLLQDQTLEVQRRLDARGRTRSVDVRPFIEEIRVEPNRVTVRCRITDSGSIRVGEVLELLRLDAGRLASPIVRTAVQWREQKN